MILDDAIPIITDHERRNPVSLYILKEKVLSHNYLISPPSTHALCLKIAFQVDECFITSVDLSVIQRAKVEPATT